MTLLAPASVIRVHIVPAKADPLKSNVDIARLKASLVLMEFCPSVMVLFATGILSEETGESRSFVLFLCQNKGCAHQERRVS